MKVCLTAEYVNGLSPPKSGEFWIGDTHVQHFGIRGWAGKQGGNLAFAIRLRNREGRLVRESFSIWRDYLADQWWRRKHENLWEKPLGHFLEAAREWAQDRVAHHMGWPTSEEVIEHIREDNRERVLSTTLGAAIKDRLFQLRRATKRPAYLNHTEDLLNNYIDTRTALLTSTLGDLDVNELAAAVTEQGLTWGNIRRLRAFLSGVLKEQAESYGPLGFKLDAFQEGCRARLDRQKTAPHPEILAIPPDDFQRFFGLLEEEPRWRQALAIRLYFATGARLQQVLRARWSDILGTAWYPFIPSERDCWFEAIERLGDDALGVIESIANHHASEQIQSLFLFPSRESGPSQPIKTVQRMWSKMSGRMYWPDLPLSHVVWRHRARTNPSYDLDFSRTYLGSIKENEGRRAVSKVGYRRRKKSVFSYNYTSERISL